MIKIVSESFPNESRVNKEVVTRKLRPGVGPTKNIELETRRKAIRNAFGGGKRRYNVRFAIDYESARYVSLGQDNVPKIVFDQTGADLNATIFDMFSGCGGDICHFLKYGFKSIVAHEIKDDRFLCLANNIRSFLPANEIWDVDVTVKQLSCLDDLKGDKKYDIIFADPPWGEYVFGDRIGVPDSNGQFVECAEMFARYSNKCKHMIFKLPKADLYDPMFPSSVRVVPVYRGRDAERRISYHLYFLQGTA
jgi:16S rRNA G966 N2-methylase RsmD